MFRIVNEESLRHLFSQFGQVVDAVICKSNIDQPQNRQSGYGFIHYPGTPQGIEASFRAGDTLVDVMIDEVNYKCKISHHLERHLKHDSVPDAANTVSSSQSTPLSDFGGPNPPISSPIQSQSSQSLGDDLIFESSFSSMTSGLIGESLNTSNNNTFVKSLPPAVSIPTLEVHPPTPPFDTYESRSRTNSNMSNSTISPTISPSLPTRNITVQIPPKTSPRMLNNFANPLDAMKMHAYGQPFVPGMEGRGKISPSYYHGSRQTFNASFANQQLASMHHNPNSNMNPNLSNNNGNNNNMMNMNHGNINPQ